MEQKPKTNLNMDPTFEIAYRGKMFEVVRWEGKPGVMFEAAVRSPGVRMLIECEKDNQKALLMTREMRREAGGYDYRLPGGKVFDSLTELDRSRHEQVDVKNSAEQAAMREAREEAGAQGGDYTLIEVSKAGASVEWDLYYYVVTGAEFGNQELEDEEKDDIETIQLSPREIYEKLLAREIKEGRSADVLWWWLAKNNFITFHV